MAGATLAVGFLVSGRGRTLDGVLRAVADGHLAVRPVLVLGDRPDLPALERARAHGVAVAVVPYRGTDPTVWAERASEAFAAAGAELLVLAGFLRVLPPTFVERWRGRVVNIHPSLLPKFGGRGLYGAHVHRAVLAAGERDSGASVHVVTDRIDGGPVLAQVTVRLRPDETAETLAERLRPHEVTVLVETLRRIADGTIPLPIPPGLALAAPSDATG